MKPHIITKRPDERWWLDVYVFRTQVFEWLQLFSLRDLHTLDLRGNAITFAGIARVLEWLLALPPSDLIRPDLLSIDMSQNKDLEVRL